MYLCVAALAESHEIAPCVCPALTYGNDVVDFLDWCQVPFLQAYLTEGML